MARSNAGTIRPKRWRWKESWTKLRKKLRRVLAAAPRNAGTRALLGELLSDRGMFEEAQRHLSEAIDVVPAAFQQLAAVKRITEADRPLVERMRNLAAGPSLDVAARVSVQFGLGKAFDDLGEYAEAMRHYEAGNRLKAMTVRLDRAAMAAKYDAVITRFSAEALERGRRALARPVCQGDDMPVFIVGMPRSGTTLVEQILSSHPAVAAGGELTFWKDRLTNWQTSGVNALDAGVLSKAAEDYRAALRGIGPEAMRVTDKEPRNFELLWLLHLAFPNTRIIHCRRNPVDTCLSIFFTNFRGSQSYAWDRGDLAFAYRHYERLMNHWRRVLPSDRFIEVEYEVLIADAEAESRRLIAFCGLEWDDACLAPERNNRVVRTATLWQARQPVYKTSVERWRRYEPWLGELRELLAEPDAAPS
jgi:tetratricopeptide (TPR) repeat protein